MHFVSFYFLLFMLVLLPLHYLLPSKLRLPLLLGASYLFYATWNIPFIGIILVTTTTDYWMAKIIERTDKQQIKRLAMISGITLNLLILGFYKYYHFASENIQSIAQLLHFPAPELPIINVILPLGISFYTFEAIGYLVDVYRGRPAAKNWLDYNFYIMYFPHLISGPIVRFMELAPQYAKPLQLPSIERLTKAFELIILGYGFKILIADQAALIANPIFEHYQQAHVFDVWSAVLAFTVQIYFDFMGYTHIARGVSLLFNIELPLNFNFPYLAQNISDFWKRWHMSLSRWIRDYLYIPLGGNRGPMLKVAFNLVLTMLIAGAWHGAGWTYILWGGYHGVLLAVYHIYGSAKKALPAKLLTSLPYDIFSRALTLFAVIYGWLLFRAPNMDVAMFFTKKMFSFAPLFHSIGELFESDQKDALIHSVLLIVIILFPTIIANYFLKRYYRIPYWAKVQICCVIMAFVMIFSSQKIEPFIYFQF